ncbi:unnamed protein product [Urochloa humidicola]
MRTSMLFGSLILLLLLARAHGRLDMHLHAERHKKEEISSDLKWQRPPPSLSSGGRLTGKMSQASERHLTSTARAAVEEDGEVKKKRTHRDVGPRLIHEDYAGPSGHSPNHHRTIRCGPC